MSNCLAGGTVFNRYAVITVLVRLGFFTTIKSGKIAFYLTQLGFAKQRQASAAGPPLLPPIL
jgi:hypothetical protein